MTGKSDNEPFARAGEGDVAVITFTRQSFPQIRAERNGQFIAVGVSQNGLGGGCRRENGVVYTQHERQLEIRIARTVNRANEHLVQRGRNYADGEIREAGLDNW